MKLVVNRCFGGFGLSDAAYEKLIEWGVPLVPYPGHAPYPKTDGVILTGVVTHAKYWDTWTADDAHRSHPLVIRVVEELGAAANGQCARLQVVEIPDGVEYEIAEYDGCEHVAEKHRTW